MVTVKQELTYSEMVGSLLRQERQADGAPTESVVEQLVRQLEDDVPISDLTLDLSAMVERKDPAEATMRSVDVAGASWLCGGQGSFTSDVGPGSAVDFTCDSTGTPELDASISGRASW